MSISGEALMWIQALGWSLLHFVWQGLLIGLLFAFARSVIARDNSSLRYALGLFSLAASALCVPLTIWVLRPRSEPLVYSLGNDVVTMETAGTLAETLESGMGFGELLPALVLIWMFGVGVMIGRAVHQWRVLDRIATSLAYRQADIEALLLRVADQFGGMHDTRVLVSRFIDTPTLIGWFKPVILLPAAVAIGFPRQQLELILAHELGHLRRFDHLVNLGQTVVETLLFYHPVVHWISREVRHEREICCDNLVLSLTDSEPREYARTLAALEDVRQLTPQLAIAASGGMLLDRVRRIIGAAAPQSGNRHGLTVTWGVVASCAVAVSATVLLTQPREEVAIESFDQPRSLPALTEVHGIELAPYDTSVEFAAIRVPDLLNPVDASSVETIARDMPGKIDEVQAPALVSPSPAAPALEFAVIDLPDSLPPVRTEVAKLEVPSAPVAAPAGNAVPGGPVLIHQVAPEYRDNGRSGSYEKVGFAFSIDRSGRVRDIRSASGDARSAFAVAARNALRQWKFDPRSVAADGVRNFHQDFEFVSASRALGDEKDGECITPTGSHVCRSGRGLGVAFKAEEKAATISRAGNLAGVDVTTEAGCVPQTGSRVCRPDDTGGLAMGADQRAETSSHVIVLAGGAP